MVLVNPGITGLSRPAYTPPRAAPGALKQIRTSSTRTELMELSIQTTGVTRADLNQQNALFHFNRLPEDLKQNLTWQGRPISDLSPQEASDLISEDGHFGVAKTAARVSDFVLKLAGDDPEKLKIGREAVLKGFKEAEKLWGGELPDICYQTLDKTLSTIDDKIKEIGGSVVDVKA